MASEDAATSYRQGIVWVVGMSAAAAGGAFLHYEQARGLSLIAKSSFLFLVLLFLLAVWSGVNCLFWLFNKVSGEEKLKELEEDHAQGRTPAVDHVSKQTEIQTDLNKAKRWLTWYHYIMLWSFALAVLFSVVLLAFGTFSTAAPVERKEQSALEDGRMNPARSKTRPTRFVVVQSAIHRTAHGKEAHTFLLDQEKGALWIMTCAKDGTVEFHRVQTVNVSGDPEDPSK
jgi:hypothetical protein